MNKYITKDYVHIQEYKNTPDNFKIVLGSFITTIILWGFLTIVL